MPKHFQYRISISWRIFFCAATGFYVLAPFHYNPAIYDDINFVNITSTSFFLYTLILAVFSPYRNGYIEVDEYGIAFPSLFMPPFGRTRILYSDFISMRDKSEGSFHDEVGSYLYIRTRKGSVKIKQWLCGPATSMNYTDLHFEIGQRFNEANKAKRD
jgi:hypothetical protein